MVAVAVSDEISVSGETGASVSAWQSPWLWVLPLPSV
jgi:hypothetical protein